MALPPDLPPLPLPPGVRSRFVDDVNGLRVHLLEAGYETGDQPCLLLLHGFPELAYSWRKLLRPLADAGFHVVAPDQRGYGRTSGWDPDYDGDVGQFCMLNLVRDALALVSALGHRRVEAVVGHDFGSPVAAWCALIRPDVFRSVALMSAPFEGPPPLPVAPATPSGDTPAQPAAGGAAGIHAALAALARPRKHYQQYYSTREADTDMRDCPQGVHAFLRAYYHVKSADWPQNRPHPLAGWTAEALAALPTYYVMDLHRNMAETVAPQMPDGDAVAACGWLTDAELAVYAAEFARTGFQGGLQWYRCATGVRQPAELRLFAGRTIDVPSCFIAGASDWGVYQKPGALERMRGSACTNMIGCDLVAGAGHWVQQERPDDTLRLLRAFLDRQRATGATGAAR